MITLGASTLYVIIWKVFYTIAMPDWFDTYTKHAMDELRASGATPTKMADQLAHMKEYKELLKNPLYEFGMTFLKIFPVGIVVTLISSVINAVRRHSTPS
jgi:hypothetical protein